MDILELLKGQLGGAISGQLGKHLGLGEKEASTGMASMLPTILGGLLKQASTKEGAETLNRTLESNDFSGGLLDKLPGMLSGGQGGVLEDLGGTLVKNLFGDKIPAILGLISKFTGMSSDKTASMLGMLAPIVMSFLGKQKQVSGLNASGLTSLLMSQKDSIAKALPPGMGSAMGFADLDLSSNSSRPAMPSATRPVSDSSNSNGLLLKLGLVGAILAGLAAVGYPIYKQWVADRAAQEELEAAPEDLSAQGSATGNIALMPESSVDDKQIPSIVERNFSKLFSEGETTLNAVTDVETAKAALPGITDLTQRLGNVKEYYDKLPAEGKTVAQGQLAKLMETFKPLLEKILAIPGVSDVLKPDTDKFFETVSGMSK